MIWHQKPWLATALKHEWGRGLHECVVVWPTTPPDAKPWLSSILSQPLQSNKSRHVFMLFYPVALIWWHFHKSHQSIKLASNFSSKIEFNLIGANELNWNISRQSDNSVYWQLKYENIEIWQASDSKVALADVFQLIIWIWKIIKKKIAVSRPWWM